MISLVRKKVIVTHFDILSRHFPRGLTEIAKHISVRGSGIRTEMCSQRLPKTKQEC
jgi:hypothetical protein